MKKKLYNPSYWLINSNHSYEYSFGIRLNVVGLNCWILCYSLARLYFGSLRLKSGNGESFN